MTNANKSNLLLDVVKLMHSLADGLEAVAYAFADSQEIFVEAKEVSKPVETGQPKKQIAAEKTPSLAVWNNRGKKSVVWRCCTRMENGPGTCGADAIHESELQSLVIRGINRTLARKDTMNETLQKNIESVLSGVDGIPFDEIDSRLEELQKELLKVANSKGNYDNIADEIYRLREAKQNALVGNAERERMKQRINEMQQFLAEQTQDITEYDEQLVRRLIEKIMVYDEKVTIKFKSGTSLDVRR